MPYSDPEKAKARGRRYYLANRERRLAKDRAYRKKNRKRLNADRRARYAANSEVILARNRAAYAKHGDRWKPTRLAHQKTHRARQYQRAYRKKHRERLKASHRAYWAKHRARLKAANLAYYRTPEAKARREQYDQTPERRAGRLAAQRRFREANIGKIAKWNAIRRVREDAAIGTFTSADWHKLMAKYDYRCRYCRKRKRLEIDHVIPLARGGRHDKSNIVPACARCNRSKGARGDWPKCVPRPSSAA